MAANTDIESRRQDAFDEFRGFFLEEHRQTRDALLDLADAFKRRERKRIPGLLRTIVQHAGPHFRFEEESLYPMLIEFFGKPYVEELFRAHDRAIQTARDLRAIVRKDRLTDEDAALGIAGARSILPHVSDCDGLSLLVEKMSLEQIDTIIATHERANLVGLDMIAWADTVRQQPANRSL